MSTPTIEYLKKNFDEISILGVITKITLGQFSELTIDDKPVIEALRRSKIDFNNLSLEDKIKKVAKKNKVWFLQFGAYSKKDSASILKETLIKDGVLDIQVSQVMNRGKMIYYVRSKIGRASCRERV